VPPEKVCSPRGPDAAAAIAAKRRALLPEPRLVAAWFGFAHGSLLLAALLVALDAELLAATFYHPRLLAAVHLLTLGWISGSILGALHLVPAMALRTRLPRHRGDLVACATFATGTVAMVASFWFWRPAGIAAGGAVAIAGAAWVAARVLPALWRAPAARAAGAAFATAFAGLFLTALLGMAAALLRERPDLAVGAFAMLFAHAHLGALGWALPIVIGAGYRLVPMLLPSAMPSPRRSLAALLTSAGAPLLLAGGLLASSAPLAAAGATAALAAVLLILRDAAWMLRHRRLRPPARPRPDLPLAHAAAALLSLVAALGCGVLLLAGHAPTGLRAAYGILALVGFFGQLIAGVGPRLVAWLCWLHAYAGSGFRQIPPTPYALVPRGTQALATTGWLAAVPALAVGAATGRAWLVRAGSLALAIAVSAGAAGLLRAAATAARRAPTPTRS
jgi:hypothetical protein